MGESDSARKVPTLTWLDDDGKTIEFRRERPQTWLEELGELNEQGKLAAVSGTLQFPHTDEDDGDDVAWL